jgi:hypothetical protein
MFVQTAPSGAWNEMNKTGIERLLRKAIRPVGQVASDCPKAPSRSSCPEAPVGGQPFSVSGSVRLDRGLGQVGEELIGHLFGDAVDQPRAELRDLAANIGLHVIL